MTCEPSPILVSELSRETMITEAIDLFLTSQMENKDTRRGYAQHLREAVEILGVETVGEIQVSHLVAYRAHITEHKTVSSATKGLISMRSFLTWVAAMDGTDVREEQMKYLLKVPKSLVITPHQALTRGEMAAMLQEAKASHPRDFALLAVAFGSGLRIAELVGLDCGDVMDDASGGTEIHVRRGKGGKDRMVPVNPDVREAVESYLEATGRHLGDTGPLFWGNDRALHARDSWRITIKSASRIVRDTAKAARVRKRVSPHALRHTFANQVFLHCNDIMVCKDLLGHASINTTVRYVAHMTRGRLRNGVPPLPLGQDAPAKKSSRKRAHKG
jgi:site-specific recombinase XerD